MTVTRQCSACREAVFSGKAVEYEYPRGSGNLKEDIDGDWEEGSGECISCGKAFCADCGDFENGLCRECKDDELGYMPF